MFRLSTNHRRCFSYYRRCLRSSDSRCTNTGCSDPYTDSAYTDSAYTGSAYTSSADACGSNSRSADADTGGLRL